MSLRTRISVALLATTVVVSFAPLPAHASVTSRGVTIPDFYTPPANLPSANGSLIRSEPLPLALSLPGLGSTLPGTATRIMYKSTDASGEPVAVTGAYVEPAASWAGGGPRPLVVLAPGTMGQGDQCSTSLALQRGLILGSEGSQTTISVGYEILAMYRLLAKGIAVVETDYVGLGTTDRLHTYVNRLMRVMPCWTPPARSRRSRARRSARSRWSASTATARAVARSPRPPSSSRPTPPTST